MFRPPISNEVHVFSGGLIAVGRGTSEIGATVDDGWFAGVLPGEDCGDSDESFPFVSATGGGGFTRFGLVIGIADFVTVREAMALARAR